MSTNTTPTPQRLHITIIGNVNSGKSTLLNTLLQQQTATTSPTPGTTTDNIQKTIEIAGIGPCLLIDTPGLNDNTPLGTQRIKQTQKAITHTDIALLIITDTQTLQHPLIKQLQQLHTPIIPIINKTDTLTPQQIATLTTTTQQQLHTTPLQTTATNPRQTHQTIIDALRRHPATQPQHSDLTATLAKKGDTVLLIMPQDTSAPQARLILPQTQTIRNLLDKQCTAICCTPQQIATTLNNLKTPPQLIITDTQTLATAQQHRPKGTLPTTFSMLQAAAKTDIKQYIKAAHTIDTLTPQSRIPIAEACSHAPQTEDIGRVKIPALLHKKISPQLQIDITSGTDFPTDLTPYSLIIHCGACMFNRKQMQTRTNQAQQQNTPITNYGIAVAKLLGILDQIDIPHTDHTTAESQEPRA